MQDLPACCRGRCWHCLSAELLRWSVRVARQHASSLSSTAGGFAPRSQYAPWSLLWMYCIR